MQRRVAVGVRVLVMATVAVFAFVACGDTPSSAPDRSSLDWDRCGDLECATFSVPLDHDRAGDERIALPVVRSRARDADERLGVLVVDPGGPGGSGTALARRLAALDSPLRERFDIVGWDARGVASGIDCDAELAALYRLDPSPDDPGEAADLDAAATTAAEACSRAAGPLLATIGTATSARDLDLLRIALGETQISFLGFSWGSVLGLEYRARHPEHLRVAVLDGVVDPDHDLVSWLAGQAAATEDAVVSLASDQQDRSVGFDRLASLFAAAEADIGGEVGPAALTRALVRVGYLDADRDPATLLDQALTRAEGGDGGALDELADAYLGSGSFGVYTATVCADLPRPDTLGALLEGVAADAVLLGPGIAAELAPCVHWPTPVRPLAAALESTPGDPPPMLLVGTTGDGATPFADAVAVAGSLEGTTLATVDTIGHTSVLSNTCAFDLAVATLLRGDVVTKSDRLRCPGDR